MSGEIEEQFDIFFQLAKVDEKNRLVYGRATEEVPDGVREVFDYESSKPLFQQWSDAAVSRTSILGKDARSYGNIREMHQPIAAGKVVEPLIFNDDQKAIDIVTYCSDDDTWDKICKGVLTGFSVGGKYARRWSDPANPSLKRYTAAPKEISYVDMPAVPTATFTMIKMDGSEELRKFGEEEIVETTSTVKIDTEALNAFTLAVGALVSLQKANIEERQRKENMLKSLGSSVGIARRDSEPLLPLPDRSVVTSDYADPANWSWEYGSTDLCEKARNNFNAGVGLEKYLDREQQILGRRITTQLEKVSGVLYQYNPVSKQITRKENKMDLNKSDIGPLIAQLAGAMNIAADQVSADPLAALHSIVQHLSSAMGSGISPISSPDSVSSTTSGIDPISTSSTSVPSMSTPTEVAKEAMPSSAPTSTTTKEAAAMPSSTSPTSTKEAAAAVTSTDSSTSAAMTKMQEQLDVLTDIVKKLANVQAPAPKGNLPSLGLNASLMSDNASPLEKALSAAASSWEKGLTSEQLKPVLEAADGDFSMAQNKALDIVKMSLTKRGFTSANKIRMLDSATLAAIRSSTQVRG